MENDLISRKGLLKTYTHWLPQLERPEDAGDRNGVKTCIAVLQDVPAVDAEPVRHGAWANVAGCRTICNKCGEYPLYDYFGRLKLSNYCPNCGAKMDGKENE